MRHPAPAPGHALALLSAPAALALLLGRPRTAAVLGVLPLAVAAFFRDPDRTPDHAAVPVDDVLSTTAAVEPDTEWLRIRAVGRYDEDATVVLRYQTRDGASGVDVVTPLVTADGTALVVDRGRCGRGRRR